MRTERIGLAGMLALPGVLTVYFGFSGGGFFPAQPAVGAVFLALVLVVRVTTAERPFAGLGLGVGVAGGALALYALWTLLSSSWSHAGGRSFIEFDRALMYALALVLFGSVARSSDRIRWMLRGLVVGLGVVCVVGLITRVLPHVWPTSPNIENSRLSYPVTYWNTLGLMAALGAVLCLHFSSSRAERAGVRALAAAAIPLFAVTLYFTFSRGAMGAAVIGLISYCAIARSRSVILGVLASGLPTLIAGIVAYDAAELATLHPATATGVSQGQSVAVVVGLCALAAGILRVGLIRIEPRFYALRAPPAVVRVRWPATAAAVIAAVVVVLALHLPHTISSQYHRFVTGAAPTLHGDLRNRLGDVANNGRTEQWNAAFAAFRSNRLHGTGAGTYQLAWERRRPQYSYLKDAHGLYFEVAGELGVVGLVLLLLAVVSLLVAAVRIARRRDRRLGAIAFALILMWALRAGVEWDWEMPAVSLWVFALGGLLLARHREPEAREEPPTTALRLVVALGFLLATAVPALVAVSEGKLSASIAAFERGDCRAATRNAFSAVSAIADQPRPYEVIGYCDLKGGFPRAGMQAMEAAVERDPGNWQYRYDLAAARAEAGLDPRPAMEEARQRNPLDDLIAKATKLYVSDRPDQWRTEGRKARDLMVVSGRVARY